MLKDPLFANIEQPGGDTFAALGQLGFHFGEKGTHTSRTMMFAELSTLLQVCAPNASRQDYADALVENNCLGKHTLSTRRLTLQRLSELYALDAKIPLFRILRQFWHFESRSHQQLALLVAIARDPLLRATAPAILSMSSGEEIARQRFTDVIRKATDGRLNDSTVDKVVRNVCSSWTQSGHLTGRSRKRRMRIEPTPVSVAFALLLGYMLGLRGHRLFDSIFTRILDRDENGLTFLAMDAKRIGLLDIKSGGGVTVVAFDAILTEKDRRLIHGAH